MKTFVGGMMIPSPNKHTVIQDVTSNASSQIFYTPRDGHYTITTASTYWSTAIDQKKWEQEQMIMANAANAIVKVLFDE